MFAILVAAITFVSPQPGAQAVGVMPIEIATDAARVDRVEFSVDGALAGVARKAPYRIAFDFGTAMQPRTIAARVWSNGFKTTEIATITTAMSEAMNVDVVEVALRVRSSHKLNASDLRVRENGVEQTIRDVAAQRPPAHFAFVVDRSLSMGDGKLAAALDAIAAARKQLREADTSSLIFFNHNVAKARTDIPRDLTPSGGTSLRDAVASIPSNGRTYAIVITDGGDRNSILSEDAALRRISTARTFIHAIVLGETHTKFLDRAAANTGGSVIEASRGTLQRRLRELIEDINSRHLLVYQSSASKSGWRAIEVTGRNGVAVVSARKGYFAE